MNKRKRRKSRSKTTSVIRKRVGRSSDSSGRVLDVEHGLVDKNAPSRHA